MTDPVTDDVKLTLNFFKINVADIERATAFYTGVFGFAVADTIATDAFEERMLVQPGAKFTLVLLAWKDGRALTIGNGWGPAGFLTRDCDAAHAKALAHGATEHRPPTDMGPMRVAFVLDPEGHELEIIQYKRD